VVYVDIQAEKSRRLPMLLSEQKFRDWYKNYCEKDLLQPGPTAILEFFQSHQQPFDREMVGL